MRKLKHLPPECWPKADHDAFDAAYRPGDIFDEDRGPGAHHSEGWRRMIRTTWRRWLGFLTNHYSADLMNPPAERITPGTGAGWRGSRHALLAAAIRRTASSG